jgi:hypothetical protein
MCVKNKTPLYLILILIFCVSGLSALELGMGFGVQSYPSSLDPGELITRTPIVYPKIEVDIAIIKRWRVQLGLMRRVYETNVFECFCIQSLETNELSCGVSYSLVNRKADFRLGAGLLTGFSTYDHGGIFYNSTSIGGSVYAMAGQPLWRDLSYAFRTMVQRKRIRVADERTLYLNIFSVEFVVFMTL